MSIRSAFVPENRITTFEPAVQFASKPKRLTFAEFFAGIGLVHLGLRQFGWECVYANDIEPKKKEMYEHQFGIADYYHVDDVWHTKNVAERIPPQTLLATASFPCVDLSLAGNRKGLAGVDSGAFYGFIRVLKELRRCQRLPELVLIENVVGFLTSHSGRDFNAAVTSLASLGYALDAFMIDAKHFVPQSRLRLFLIGCQVKNIPGEVLIGLREPSALRPSTLCRAMSSSELETGWFHLDLPPLPPTRRTLPEVIETDDAQEWWAEEKVQKHLREMNLNHRDRIEKLIRADSISVGTIYRRVRQGRSRSEVRSDGLAGCLRTPRGGSSRQIVFRAGFGGLKMRWMSPREYAHLQGAPSFPIAVERNQALFGFGDAVCVPVISWIAEHGLSQLVGTQLSSIAMT